MTLRGNGEIHVCASPPAYGIVYTVAGYDPYVIDDAIILIEMDNGIFHLNGAQVGWNANLFRPVCERGTETGMAILKKISETGKLPKRVKQKEAV